MEDEVLSEFYKFVKSRSKRTTWAHPFVEALVEEVIRLRIKYEGFTYIDTQPSVVEKGEG